MNPTFRFTLTDRKTERTQVVEVTPNGNGGFEISMPGYGSNGMEDGHGAPIFVELYDGEITAHLWADINNPDPTASINMEGAREEARQAD
jgi:hypothetical protein